jgi:hypothetical protein
LLNKFPEARSFIGLAEHIAAGAAVYAALLALLYASTLLRLFRLRRAKPTPERGSA